MKEIVQMSIKEAERFGVMRQVIEELLMRSAIRR